MFRSCISKDEVTGLFKILLYALCFQLAILVGVPTPELINGGVTLVEITISSAAQSAATSSTLLYDLNHQSDGHLSQAHLELSLNHLQS